jgi:integrase
VLTASRADRCVSGTGAERCSTAARAAGLNDVTPHDLRHTAASLAVASGATVKAVQRMLGHASAAMTLDVYSGLFDEDLGDLAARMDAAARAAADARVGAGPDGGAANR